MPAAEVDVSAALVAALIEEQHPDLAAPLQQVANGWDNVIFRLGEDLAVRLPRRAVAVALIEHEQRWLPELAPGLPAPIPVPVRIGAPSEAFRWPWSITPWFDGHSLATLPVHARRPYAAALGRFLACLHTAAPPEAPPNPVRGIPLAGRTEVFRRQVATIAVDRPDAVLEVWDVLVATPPWPGPPLWLHGDPHPGNVLVRDNTTLRGHRLRRPDSRRPRHGSRCSVALVRCRSQAAAACGVRAGPRVERRHLGSGARLGPVSGSGPDRQQRRRPAARGRRTPRGARGAGRRTLNDR